MRLPECTDAQVRIGVAITVPEPYGPALQAARASFGDPLARSIPPHITLLGPTAVDKDALGTLTEHLTDVAARSRPFVVHLRGTGTFQPVSPVVFVQVVEGISMCEDLERAVRSGFLAQELRFNYHPHVTVAHELDTARLDRAFAELADYDATFEVPAIQSYEHGDDGVWRPARSYPLGDARRTGRPADAEAAAAS